MNISMRERMKALFLDWFNNYLTVEKMALDYNLEPEYMAEMIEIGRDIHEKDIKESV